MEVANILVREESDSDYVSGALDIDILTYFKHKLFDAQKSYYCPTTKLPPLGNLTIDYLLAGNKEVCIILLHSTK